MFYLGYSALNGIIDILIRTISKEMFSFRLHLNFSEPYADITEAGIQDISLLLNYNIESRYIVILNNGHQFPTMTLSIISIVLILLEMSQLHNFTQQNLGTYLYFLILKSNNRL